MTFIYLISAPTDINWTSGALFSDAAGADFDFEEMKDAARLAELRDNQLLPLVYLDVEVKVHTSVPTCLTHSRLEVFRNLTCTVHWKVCIEGQCSQRSESPQPDSAVGIDEYASQYVSPKLCCDMVPPSPSPQSPRRGGSLCLCYPGAALGTHGVCAVL